MDDTEDKNTTATKDYAQLLASLAGELGTDFTYDPEVFNSLAEKSAKGINEHIEGNSNVIQLFPSNRNKSRSTNGVF